MFDIRTFLSELKVEQDDAELEKAQDIIKLTEIICDDHWLARQDHYGSAGAMERQIEYIGSNLLPNAEGKLQRMSSKGVMGESYTQDHWFGTTNEEPTENAHVSQEVPFDVQVEAQQDFVEQLQKRMRTAAILFVTRVRAHDILSDQLEQLSYSGIKAKAAANRQAATGTG